jgi:NAD-dependent dihydropyrimidine dehydrogenase PreA subunit
MIREIIRIDENLCDGCGVCIPACEEGAIAIVDGKARLVSETLCDGMGACLGHCPQDAIKIERREADAFDESAVESHLNQTTHEPKPAPEPVGGEPATPHMCPSMRFNRFDQPGADTTPKSSKAAVQATEPAQSALSHWPVQLRLLPPHAPVLKESKLLVAADCVPVALADFHSRLLEGRAVVIACPKLDDPSGYVEKLAEMIRLNDLEEITVARMEVPCCRGIVQMLVAARDIAGVDVPINEVVVGTHGEVIQERRVETPCGVG